MQLKKITVKQRTRGYLAALLLCVGLPIGLHGDGKAEVLEISLQSASQSYSADQAISLSITIRNTSGQRIVLYPGFSPSPAQAFPDTKVEFEIRDQHGKAVRRDQTDSNLFKRKTVTACDFEELPSGWFLGVPFFVNRHPYAYPLKAPGEYTIRAKITFRARHWVKSRQDQSFSMISVDSLAEGVFYSNEITVHLDPPSGV